MRGSTIIGALGVLTLAWVVAVSTAPAEEIPPAEGSTRVPAVIPAEEKARKNPVAPTRESIAHGRLIFSSQCTMCHGAKGDGTGDLVERLKLVMPDLTARDTQKQWTDGAMFHVLTRGHGRMQAQARFDKKTRWDLINYIRTLPGGE